MGAPGWTSFCEKGHIVEVCPHHCIEDEPLTECGVCGSPVIGTDFEWGDPDYVPHEVPEKPIGKEELRNTHTCPHCKKAFTTSAGTVDVYDVSKLLKRRKKE